MARNTANDITKFVKAYIVSGKVLTDDFEVKAVQRVYMSCTKFEAEEKFNKDFPGVKGVTSVSVGHMYSLDVQSFLDMAVMVHPFTRAYWKDESAYMQEEIERIYCAIQPIKDKTFTESKIWQAIRDNLDNFTTLYTEKEVQDECIRLVNDMNAKVQ